MSLEKAIAHGKEHRKPYYHSGRFDYTCRPHGRCGVCYGNRKGHHEKRAEEWTRALVDEGIIGEG